ncbi:SacI homology domain-containing protein [Melampsora americana]|nr:SacI homology domain-containing protein [Melampsora americana]
MFTGTRANLNTNSTCKKSSLGDCPSSCLHPGPLERFSLYETRRRFYITGSDQPGVTNRVLKIDKNLDDDDKLVITEDATIYTASQLKALIEQLTLGNAASGGLTRPIDTFWGIVGRPNRKVPKNTQAEEARLMAAFRSVDLSKNFYFSLHLEPFLPSETMMKIVVHLPEPLVSIHVESLGDYHDKFFWNHYLLLSAFELNVFGRTVYVAVIARRSRHFAGARFLKRGVSEDGYVANEVEIEQIVCDALTTALHIPDPEGRGDFHARKPNPRYTSYVQLRGSIPLLWNQDTTLTKAKPPIEFSVIDPYFSGAARHFDDLFARYGPSVTVLNLIKEKERQPRESKLLPEFRQCIEYLNQFLTEQDILHYLGFDMSAAQRSRQVDVISYLGGVAEEVIDRTKFFHSGPEPSSRMFQAEEPIYNDDGEPDESGETQPVVYRAGPALQCGVCRTNCIDCIDRTNAAQFVVGKAALAHQLHALGIIRSRVTPYDSDAVDILTNMYHDLGDTIALQYGGSHLVNTLQTYRKTGNQYKSHARDTLEGLKRFYANSFADADKQAAINLFLGIEAPAVSLTPIASTSSSSTLNLPPLSDSTGAAAQSSTTAMSEKENQARISMMLSDLRFNKRSYTAWFDQDHLIRPTTDPTELQKILDDVMKKRGNDDYYIRYYRPWLWTSTENHLGRKMNSSDMFAPKGLVYSSEKAKEDNLSPFKRRRGINEISDRMPRHSAERTPHGVGVSGGVRRWLKTKSTSTLKSSFSAHKSESPARADLRFPIIGGDHHTELRNQQSHGDGFNNDLSARFEGDEGNMPGGKESTEIELVTTKLLKPSVDFDEEQEYHSYLHQFDQLCLHSTSSLDDIYEADFKIYEKSISLPSTFDSNHSIKVDPRSLQLYEEVVMVATTTTTGLH